jgi:hypothetical protein
MQLNLCQVLSMGEADGGNILRQLLQVLSQLASMPEDLAPKVLCVSRDWEISAEGDGGSRGKSMFQVRATSNTDQPRGERSSRLDSIPVQGLLDVQS